MTVRRESKREKQKNARHAAAAAVAPVSDLRIMRNHLLKYPAFEGPVAEIEVVDVPKKAKKKAKKKKKSSGD